MSVLSMSEYLGDGVYVSFDGETYDDHGTRSGSKP
jgi:hypothetical protein